MKARPVGRRGRGGTTSVMDTTTGLIGRAARRAGTLAIASLAASLALGVAGCTWAPRASAPEGRTLREVARFERDQCTGMAVTPLGKAFVCFPTWNTGHRVHVAHVRDDGTWTPWPDETWNSWRIGDPVTPDRFVCVQSVVAGTDGDLWVLDPADPMISGTPPAGATPRLMQFDVESGSLRRSYDLSSVAPPGSYVNDVRIDSARNVAYMTDSGKGGLIVLDLASGVARRVLASHPSTMAEAGVVAVIDGRELRFAGGPMQGQPLIAHSDGIALDAARGWLYWQALTGRTLYRIPTHVLADPAATDEQLASAIENLGASVMTDGMEVDERGNVYFTAIEKNAIYVRTPEGVYAPLSASPMLVWPDSLAFGPGSSLYVACSQIHRTGWFVAGQESHHPQTPYRVLRTTKYGR